MGALVYTLLLAAFVVFGGPTHPVAEETVVVLPGEHGKIGGVVVHRGSQEIVLDKAYASSHLGLDGVLQRKQASPEEVQELFSPLFEVSEIARLDILQQNPRFRERGLEWFEEHIYLLRSQG